jgi:hypothetical protein
MLASVERLLVGANVVEPPEVADLISRASAVDSRVPQTTTPETRRAPARRAIALELNAPERSLRTLKSHLVGWQFADTSTAVAGRP